QESSRIFVLILWILFLGQVAQKDATPYGGQMLLIKGMACPVCLKAWPLVLKLIPSSNEKCFHRPEPPAITLPCLFKAVSSRFRESINSIHRP
ncbi:MAG TPA: hypothetical protein PLU64_19945, partial [Saprospiraceae bacterium]|nr:hypothetical protein [Saprospiraceae bacterium]